MITANNSKFMPRETPKRSKMLWGKKSVEKRLYSECQNPSSFYGSKTTSQKRPFLTLFFGPARLCWAAKILFPLPGQELLAGNGTRLRIACSALSAGWGTVVRDRVQPAPFWGVHHFSSWQAGSTPGSLRNSPVAALAGAGLCQYTPSPQPMGWHRLWVKYLPKNSRGSEDFLTLNA